MGRGRQILDVNAVNNDCTLPSQYAVDYEALLSAARAESEPNAAFFRREQFLFKWSDLYGATVAHVTNIVRFRYRTFEYIFDLYSGLEATGEVPYDQTIQDRVVGVLGTSARAEEMRDASRIRGWVGPTEEFLGTERDKGHFMAHCIGGGLDVNVLSQERLLMCVIEQLFPLGRRLFLNSDCEKAGGKSLETQDHRALKLFAPKLIHESRNCAIVHMPQKHYSWSTMSSSEL